MSKNSIRELTIEEEKDVQRVVKRCEELRIVGKLHSECKDDFIRDEIEREYGPIYYIE